MLTDGALRMLTLLYFHDLGYSPINLAFLFLFYEFFGIVTNLFGGWLAQKFGFKATLIYGLSFQISAMLMLSFLQHNWESIIAVPFVMSAQALSGIAKDLTKMSSKTAIKFLIPENKKSTLFKWVAILTGSKNAIKGLGFFVGGMLLQVFGFQYSLWMMAGFVFISLGISSLFLPTEMGKGKSKNKFSEIFKQNKNIKILSAARFFLFGARDIWFVVAIPIFFVSTLGWTFAQVGAFMATWVIAYGFFQSVSPSILKLRSSIAPSGRIATECSGLLFLCLTCMTVCFLLDIYVNHLITIGLYVFGFIFAINSSVHSYLVLNYADGDKASVNVGFYYMANAGGRLIGTMLSGILFQLGSVSYCLVGSAIFLLFSTLICFKLPRE